MTTAQDEAAANQYGEQQVKEQEQAQPQREYPRWYYAADGTGMLIRDANHHIDYPNHTALSPAEHGIETAPAAKPTPI